MHLTFSRVGLPDHGIGTTHIAVCQMDLTALSRGYLALLYCAQSE